MKVDDKYAARKARLEEELKWLQDNGGNIIRGKRARPRMVYTAEDIAVSNAEQDLPAYQHQSESEESEDSFTRSPPRTPEAPVPTVSRTPRNKSATNR